MWGLRVERGWSFLSTILTFFWSPGVSFVQHADWAGWLIDKEMGGGERRQRVREREGCCRGHDPGRLGVELSNLGKGPGSPLSTAFLLVWGLACVS